jgi:spermidine synthase
VTRRVLAAAALAGFSALVCEVAWARALRLVVGDTALAVAAVLAVFFAGMALGAWLIGNRAPRVRNPLALCAKFQVLLALLALGLLPCLTSLADGHHAAVRSAGGWIDLPLALIEAAALLALPTLLIGGTIPLMLQSLALSSSKEQTVLLARLYACSTLGGAVGAAAAGLWLVPSAGLWIACGAAAAASLGAALLIWKHGETPKSTHECIERGGEKPPLALLRVVALGTGFAALGCEVLWVRMLSDVLSNSSGAFGILLGCVLLGWALGAALAGWLDTATRWAPLAATLVTLGFSVVLITLAQGSLFPAVAALQRLFGVTELIGGLLSEVAVVLGVTLIPAALLGMTMPLLYAAWPIEAQLAGQRWGRVSALTTAGAVGGSLATAALLIPLLHVRGAAAVLAGLCIFMGLLLWSAARPQLRLAQMTAGGLFVLVAAGVIMRTPSVPLPPGDHLVDRVESVGANVSVTASPDGARRLLINDRYVVGGTEGRMLETRQAVIPLLLHPAPRRIFHLGLGTGHTAGALGREPHLERLISCENLPGVVDMAKEWFADSALGLFENSKAQVVVADGRHHLATNDEQFDLIVIDNLLPWIDGTGHLLSREFFALLRERLADGGVACVWLPLHQVDVEMIAMIHRSLAAEFPSVHLWLARPELETSVGLIVANGPLGLNHLLRDRRFQDRQLREALELAQITDPADIFAGLCGVDAVAASGGPLNTDMRPQYEAKALALLHGDLAQHPELRTSPAMAFNWQWLSGARRGAQSSLRQTLGADLSQLPAEQRVVVERVWNRWLNQSDIVEGFSLLCRGDARVESLFLRAAERDPADPLPARALSQLVETLARSESWSAVAALGRQCEGVVVLSLNARIALAVGNRESGRSFRARAVLQEILDAHPGHPTATYEMVVTLVLEDRQAEALALVESLEALHPDHPLTHRLLASMRTDEGN